MNGIRSDQSQDAIPGGGGVAADLATVLDATCNFLRRYVIFAMPAQVDAVALFVGHTWLYDEFDTTPYLAIQSPEKGSGKTRLLECLRLVTRDPVPMAGASLAALFRIIDERHPTLLLDEADTIFGKRTGDATEHLRGLLNNGYRRGVPYYRVVGEGKKMHVDSFDVFCPKAVASIGRLPDTVQDRSVVVTLKRRTTYEPVARFRFRAAEREAITIREWWETLTDQLKLAEEASVPDELPDRAADSWEPLLALADAAGGGWPARGRAAAIQLSGLPNVEEDKPSIQLLSDVRDIFTATGVERISIAQLMEALRTEDAFQMHPWREWNHGAGLKPTSIGRMLTPYVGPARQLWIDGANTRGYELEQLEDAFARYLPPSTTAPVNRYTASPDREPTQEASGLASQLGLSGWTPERRPDRGDDQRDAIACVAYSDHHQHHRFTDSGWVCEACS